MPGMLQLSLCSQCAVHLHTAQYAKSIVRPENTAWFNSTSVSCSGPQFDTGGIALCNQRIHNEHMLNRGQMCLPCGDHVIWETHF